jgi:hypothetical protein
MYAYALLRCVSTGLGYLGNSSGAVVPLNIIFGASIGPAHVSIFASNVFYLRNNINPVRTMGHHHNVNVRPHSPISLHAYKSD